jgi:hypothetical protein
MGADGAVDRMGEMSEGVGMLAGGAESSILTAPAGGSAVGGPRNPIETVSGQYASHEPPHILRSFFIDPQPSFSYNALT